VLIGLNRRPGSALWMRPALVVPAQGFAPRLTHRRACIAFTPEGGAFAQGIGGVRSSHGVAGAGARERGAPQSPVFGVAENAPK
jgi:hypothetical protein